MENESNTTKPENREDGIQANCLAISSDIQSMERATASVGGTNNSGRFSTDRGDLDSLKTVKERRLGRKSSEDSKQIMSPGDGSPSKLQVPSEKGPYGAPKCDDTLLQGFLQGANNSNSRRQSVCPEIEKTLNIVKMNGTKMSLYHLRKDVCALVDNHLFESIHEDE